jgi:hypothetical protein
MNLNTQKVDVTTENNEKIIWFEYDAADLYIIRTYFWQGLLL